MSNNISEKIKKELLDYNFLDEEWSDDEIQQPVLQEKVKEKNPMKVIERKQKMSVKQKMYLAKQRLQSKRISKPKLKKQSVNVLTKTRNMIIYLQNPSVIKIREELSQNEFIIHLAEKFPKLYKEYSKIFNKTLDGEMDLEMLGFLCTQHEQLKRGSDQYNTDARVGQKVFDKFAKQV